MQKYKFVFFFDFFEEKKYQKNLRFYFFWKIGICYEYTTKAV